MEHLYSEFRHYDQGYTFGLNPVFANCEDLSNVAPAQRNEAFIRGFTIGRREYEKLNGKVAAGIPKVILTEKLLIGFAIDGQLGIPLQAENFNDRQLQIIRQHYEYGASRYNFCKNESLFHLLIDNGISILP